MYWITKKLDKYVNEEVLKSHGTMHYHQSYSTMCSCISDMCNCSTHVLFGISCMSSSHELAVLTVCCCRSLDLLSTCHYIYM